MRRCFPSTQNVEVLSSFKPELKLKDTESAAKSKLIELLTPLKGFKFVATLILVFKKTESKAKTKFENFFSNSKVEIIINESDIDDVFQSIIVQNIDENECFKWSIVKYLNPADCNPERITKAHKEFAKKLGFKDKISKRN